MIVNVPTIKVKKNTKFFMKSMMFGLYFNISVVLEHPFETLKTQWQKRYTLANITTTSTQIYKESGINGFYKGLVPNLIKSSIKNIFRLPAMIYLPGIFKKYLAKTGFYFDSLPKILAGISFSNFEVFLLTPLERLKVFLMTESVGMTGFYKKHKGNIIRQLYKGLGPTYWKTNTGILTFIISNHYIKRFWKEHLGRERLSSYDYLTIATIVGSLGAFTTMPFDFLKTQAQLERKDGNTKQESTLKQLLRHFRQNNVKVLYTGWHLRFSHTIIGSLVGVILLEKFENDFRKLH